MSLKLAAIEPKKILSMTGVVTTLAETLFDTGGQSCKVVVMQEYLGKGNSRNSERSIHLLCGKDTVCTGATLVTVLNKMCAVIANNSEKVPISKLSDTSYISKEHILTFKGTSS